LKFKLFLIITVFIIAIDLITKNIAEKVLTDKVITVIPNFFDLVLVWNKGAAFGILSEAPEYVRRFILITSSFVAGIITTFYAYKKNNELSNIEVISLSLIAGGAIGNLYDRLFIGEVRDFLDFYVKEHHWPAFNIADASITIGIALFVLYELFLKRKENEYKA